MKKIELDNETKKLIDDAIEKAPLFEKWCNSDKEEDKEKARELLLQIATIDSKLCEAGFYNIFSYFGYITANNNEEFDACEHLKSIQ